MSSISTNKKNGTKRLIFQVNKGAPRAQIYLGRIPIKQAEAIKRRIDSLIAAKRSNSSVDPETASWIAGVDTKLRESLVRHGLAQPSAVRLDLTLGQLIDTFYQSQAVKPATLAAYKQATESLLSHFGRTALVRVLEPHQLEAWHKSMHASGLATATVTKRVNIAKAVFGRAVKWGMIDECPLRHVKRGSQVNPSRLHYVSREAIDAVLPSCPDDESRLIVVLARFAGLRCPSEVFCLLWRDIDLEKSVIRVRSSKLASYGQKGVRDVPIAPEVRAGLTRVGLGRPDELVVPRVASKSTNMRSMLEAAILRAGVTPWPRLFQNLRASCEMDWADKAGHHAAAAWIGHSLEVSAKHYVRVRDDHFEKVTGRVVDDAHSDALTTQSATQQGPVPKSTGRQREPQGPSNGEVAPAGATPCGEALGNLMGDTGFEEVQKSNKNPVTLQEVDAFCDADSSAGHFPAEPGNLGELPRDFQTILGTLVSLSPEALKALGALIQVIGRTTSLQQSRR